MSIIAQIKKVVKRFSKVFYKFTKQNII